MTLRDFQMLDRTGGNSHLVCSTSTVCTRSSIIEKNNNSACYGILITLEKGVCKISFCPDKNYRDIHPNIYAPASLEGVHKMGGGGSGVAVFAGNHPELGDVVMKHGGDKDMKELFALATITEELQARGKSNPLAAQDLKRRIPEFRMIYISPNHLGEKRRALWHRLQHLYKYSSRNLLLLSHEDEKPETGSDEDEKPEIVKEEIDKKSDSEKGGLARKTLKRDPDDVKLKMKPGRRMMVPPIPGRCGLAMSKSGTVSGHRDISVYESDGDQDSDPSSSACSVHLLGDSLSIVIPRNSENDCNKQTRSNIKGIEINGDGYQMLKFIVDDLVELMKEHKWKFTLGQKKIGGEEPKTGNLWLYACKLEGKLLDNLITQKIKLVKDLATLTSPEEQDWSVLQRVRKEVAMFEEEESSPELLSKEADSFVGNAIKKNFQHVTGRFPVLEQLGKQFREHKIKVLRGQGSSDCLPSHTLDDSSDSIGSSDQDSMCLVLTKEEEIPAHHMGALTRPGALMGDIFENVPLEPTVLDTMNPFYWRNLLRAAVQPRGKRYMQRTSTMALTRIWTCGLTDAGVHNLFLDEDSIWLFDLGQPQLYSAPGFLTKFLFSFFHTLGMEETGTEGDWVCRFVVNPSNGKLRLTPETEVLLSKAHESFEVALDRIIAELFDNDDSLRWLLIQYVTLQLFSDASFCLQRWTVKGGGRTRDSNHQKGIEKWLWRALWDMYMAYDINTRETWFSWGVEHPSHRESNFSADMLEVVFGEEYASTLKRFSSLDHSHGSGSVRSSLTEDDIDQDALADLNRLSSRSSKNHSQRDSSGLGAIVESAMGSESEETEGGEDAAK